MWPEARAHATAPRPWCDGAACTTMGSACTNFTRFGRPPPSPPMHYAKACSPFMDGGRRSTPDSKRLRTSSSLPPPLPPPPAPQGNDNGYFGGGEHQFHGKGGGGPGPRRMMDYGNGGNNNGYSKTTQDIGSKQPPPQQYAKFGKAALLYPPQPPSTVDSMNNVGGLLGFTGAGPKATGVASGNAGSSPGFQQGNCCASSTLPGLPGALPMPNIGGAALMADTLLGQQRSPNLPSLQQLSSLSLPQLAPGALGACSTAPPAPAPPGRPVFLAPATAGITPVSTRKPPSNEEIAREFLRAPRERQAKMLADPNVARAIMQTVAESSQQAATAVPQMVNMLGSFNSGLPPPPQAQPAVAGGMKLTVNEGGMPSVASTPAPPAGTPAWTGMFTLARNNSKLLSTRATLLHGRVQDVEVALRSAAGHQNVLDITHRMPFEEAARRVQSGTLVCMTPPTPLNQAALDEYEKYFRSKQRAGVVQLDGSLSLYVMPCGHDFPALRDSVYALGPHIPRSGCLLGLIAQGSVLPTASATAGKAAKNVAAAASAQPAASAPPADQAATAAGTVPAPSPQPAVAPAVAQPPQTEGSDAAAQETPVQTKEADNDAYGEDLSHQELFDFFSNPELIKGLSSSKGEGQG